MQIPNVYLGIILSVFVIWNQPLRAVPVDGPQEECNFFYEKAIKSENEFIGYGSGKTHGEAVQLAAEDILRQIDLNISATTEMNSSAKSVQYSATSTAKVSGILPGTKVLKKCTGTLSTTPNSTDVAVVLSVGKTRLATLIGKRLINISNQFESILSAFTPALTVDEKIRLIGSKRDLIEKLKTEMEQLQSICTRLPTCHTETYISSTSANRLSVLASMFIFRLDPKDTRQEIAKKIKVIMASNGIYFTADETKTETADLNCEQQISHVMSAVVVSLSCSLRFVSNYAPVLVKFFQARSIGNTEAEALQAAIQRLYLEESAVKVP